MFNGISCKGSEQTRGNILAKSAEKFFPAVSTEKLKAVTFDCAQIREHTKSPRSKDTMNIAEADA